MKKFVLSVFLVMALISVMAGGRFYVKVKPVKPAVVVNMGQCPGPKHVWVDGYWVWMPGPGRYEWVPGAWKIPPGKYKHWVPGHWKKSRYGWYWVDDHWK